MTKSRSKGKPLKPVWTGKVEAVDPSGSKKSNGDFKEDDPVTIVQQGGVHLSDLPTDVRAYFEWAAKYEKKSADAIMSKILTEVAHSQMEQLDEAEVQNVFRQLGAVREDAERIFDFSGPVVPDKHTPPERRRR